MARLTNIVAATAMLATLVAPSLADCKPLHMVATTDLVSLPDHSSMFVPVKFGDVPKLMMLDTGAAWSMLSPEVKDELNLKGHEADIRMYDVLGRKSEQFVITPMEFARLKNSHTKLMVMPAAIWSTQDEAFKPVAGLLGVDILGQFDVSIDFARKKLDLLDPDHCEGEVVYWGAKTLAVVPFDWVDSSHISLLVVLDGQRIEAILDTGASNSTINADEAIKRFGLTLGSADTPESGLLNGADGVKAYRHKFETLSFGGVMMRNPEITIIPDKLSDALRYTEAGSRIAKEGNKEDVLLGMNVLKDLHVYISYKEKKLYITPAVQPNP
jgi:predicted aspartyl protease